MSEVLKCARCGEALSAARLEGLCPVCLARISLGLHRKRSARRSRKSLDDEAPRRPFPNRGSSDPRKSD